MTKPKILVVIFMLLVIGLPTYWILTNRIEQEAILDILSTQFSNQYHTTTTEINESLVYISYSSTSPNSIDEPDEYDEKASPLIIIQDVKTKKITLIYEISFGGKNYENDNKGNLIHAATINFRNLDKDEEKEIYTEWNISYGGSGGLKGIIILDKVGDKWVPLKAIPKDPNDDSKVVLTEKLSNQRAEFSVTGLTGYVRIADLNKDGLSEVLLGSYIWDKEESHFSEHYWNLRVYEINNANIPNWWNNGLAYKTDQKIGFEENDSYKLFEVFQSRLNK